MFYQVKARLDEELKQQFEEALFNRKMSQQAAIVEAIQHWMGIEARPVEKPQYSRELQLLIEQMQLFVSTASEEDVRLLKSMLAAQTQLAKAKQKIWAKQGLGS